MSADDQRRKPALGLAKGAAGAAAPHCRTANPETRPDGTLDWSIYMARAQGGDRNAYRRLLEEIAPYVRALAARRIRDRNDIEDTMQDILLTVHKVRNTYDPARPFGPWLVTIANRRIIDRLRRQGWVGSHETSLDPEHEALWTSQSPPDEAAPDAGMLAELIECLPAGQRDAVRMLKLEEMSLQEAAAASGMSVAALKTATHRALKSLRKLIEKRGDNT